MQDKGYVYILVNPAFRENWVKIGKSSRPVNIRSKELDNTAVPLPFDIYATLCTVKYSEAENLVHSFLTQFTNRRIRSNREFFNVKPKEALDIFYKVKSLIDDAEIDEVYKHAKKEQAKPVKKKQAKNNLHLFYCTRGGCNAIGYMGDNEKFVVMAGSELRNGVCAGLKPQSQEKRQAFIDTYCTQEQGKIILKEDYTFSSPSAAAAMMAGGAADGWYQWKDAENKTLHEIYRK